MCDGKRDMWMCTGRCDHGWGLTLNLSAHSKNHLIWNSLSFYNIIIMVVKTEYMFLFCSFSISFLSKSGTKLVKMSESRKLGELIASPIYLNPTWVRLFLDKVVSGLVLCWCCFVFLSFFLGVWDQSIYVHTCTLKKSRLCNCVSVCCCLLRVMNPQLPLFLGSSLPWLSLDSLWLLP